LSPLTKIILIATALWLFAESIDAAKAVTEPSDVMLLAGGVLPLCSSIAREQCSGAIPSGRRDTPTRFMSDAKGQRLREVVDFAGSKNAASKSIYLHFVAMAKAAHVARTKQISKRPHIVVLTSASEDPFDAVDFYLGAFQQAGAEVTWLPLDAAVRASFGGDCAALSQVRKSLTGSPDRDAIYPDLALQQTRFCQDRSQLRQILARADGVFFNGGDQSLSKAAWFDDQKAIAELTLLQTRLRAGTLVIGGTSAGTAVMSVGAMISNGESTTALLRGAMARAAPPLDCGKRGNCPEGLREDDLTYDASGGLKLFPLGVLDTHFAARQRHGRLAKLLIDSQNRFGFGVDETTALLVAATASGYRLRALGAGAVWIFDAQNAVDASKLAAQATALKPDTTLPWPRQRVAPTR
jgi:cyanophycinase